MSTFQNVSIVSTGWQPCPISLHHDKSSLSMLRLCSIYESTGFDLSFDSARPVSTVLDLCFDDLSHLLDLFRPCSTYVSTIFLIAILFHYSFPSPPPERSNYTHSFRTDLYNYICRKLIYWKSFNYDDKLIFMDDFFFMN